MKTGNGNAQRGSATSMDVAERLPHRGRSLNIANLPAEIRDELNYRINDGDAGNELVQWLNSKPEVVEVVNDLFDGTPISEQNLSEWRKRGYQKWLTLRNMFDESNALGDNAEVLAETGIDCDKLILTLTAAYAEATQNWIITPGEQMLYKLAVYKNLVSGVIALQRAELQKVRLEIARERLELLREKRRNKSATSSGPSTETASSPGSAPAPHQCTATVGSAPRMEGSAPSLPRAELPNPAPAPVISQNIPSSPPVPAPASPTPAPRSNSNAEPSARRANVPQNAPPGTVISLNPLRIV